MLCFTYQSLYGSLLMPSSTLDTLSLSPVYQLIYKQIDAIISGESDMIANMANISAVLYHNLEDVNWAGFYLFKQNQLVLGPFQGQVACIRIEMGKGVCGTAASKREVVVVKDVHQFDGHIACDAASNSEIVLPIMFDDNLIGVMDIDSPSIGRFSTRDQAGLKAVVGLLEKSLSDK